MSPAYPLRLICVVTSIAFLATKLASGENNGENKIEFNRDIRPILSDNCFPCHGPDKNHREADLRLDLREEAIGKAIVPSRPMESKLVERILSRDVSEVMPPVDSHKKLTDSQKETLRQWIAQGAEYQLHWAYEKPRKASIPINQNAVDALVQNRLKTLELKPSPPADRRILIRRLYFDLIGLPPTSDDANAFINDLSKDAFEKLVDRLLKNPHYGERMALGWLDVVRYADTIGYHSDTPRNVWPYRDWVIRSFNENKRFDRFTREQLAGDLLPDADQSTRVASCFNRLLLSTEEGGAQAKDYEQRMLTDRVRAVGAVWLGQTTGCAQCHDHKFDPFTTRDFYSLGAFFADIQEPIVQKLEEGMVVASLEEEKRLADFDAEIRKAKQELETILSQSEQDGKREALIRLQKERNSYFQSLPKCLVSTSMKKRRVVRILPRGDWMDESGEAIRPSFPQYLMHSSPSDRELNRLDLANWLVSRENPLTSRTVMNRLWKQFFGSGLSRVLDDLGAQGEPPSNPELLDWLACEFMDSGWDINHMVRTIVTSATYQQSSVATPAMLALDPNNREFARQSTFRLDAELIRDNVLAISGLLTTEIGGPSKMPYQPEGYWDNLNFPRRTYQADTGASQYRRGLYTWWQRSFLHPSMLALDAPTREECCAERSRSNIPQQALVLLNDPTYVEAARAFAMSLLKDSGSDEKRIRRAWQRVLQREPTDLERKAIETLLTEHRLAYREDPKSAQQLLRVGNAPSPDGSDALEIAAWTHVTRVLLNLHETITRN